MKNFKTNQLKKCIFLTQSELEDILSEIMQKTVTVNVDLYGLSPCTEDDSDDLSDVEVCKMLSEYFDVNVTSIHIDDCDIVGVWVAYKDKDDTKMNFTIETLNDNGSGMEYRTKEDFVNEISLMVDDCIANGGTFFDVQVDSDASCFCNDDED